LFFFLFLRLIVTGVLFLLVGWFADWRIYVLWETSELRNEVQCGINGWEEICYEVQEFEDLCTVFVVVLVDLCRAGFACSD
jgi:hypothetical protein